MVIAIIFAVVALYIGFLVLGWITKGIDEEKELAKGNAAVGILVASVFIAIALVVQSGVSGLSVGINKAMSIGILTGDGILTVVIAIVQLLLGIVLAIGAIYLALNILDRLTKGVSMNLRNSRKAMLPLLLRWPVSSLPLQLLSSPVLSASLRQSILLNFFFLNLIPDESVETDRVTGFIYHTG